MNIYLISGYDYDPVEGCRNTVAHICKTREEVESKLAEYIKDIRSILDSCQDGDNTDYTECLYSRNGHTSYYSAKVICDMADPKQRQAYMDYISQGWLSADKYNWSEVIDSHVKELRLVSISIKEVEI